MFTAFTSRRTNVEGRPFPHSNNMRRVAAAYHPYICNPDRGSPGMTPDCVLPWVNVLDARGPVKIKRRCIKSFSQQNTHVSLTTKVSRILILESVLAPTLGNPLGRGVCYGPDAKLTR